MNVREWSLIAFTILGQMSVGSFLVLGVVRFFATRKSGSEEADRLSDFALYAIGPVLILGLIASIFHLGKPINAYLAVTNIGTSWLSREILFGVIFAVLGAIYALLQWRKIGPIALRVAIGWLTAIAGVALVYSMAKIYMLETQPAWNSFMTILAFYTTTLLLGALAMGVAFVANFSFLRRKDPSCEEVQCELLRGSIRWIAVASIVLLGVELLALPIFTAYLAAAGGAASTSASMLIGEFNVIFILRLIFAFVGAGIFGIFLYQTALSPGQEKAMGNFTYAAFVLVLVAEVLGRFLFYATQVQISI
jgi:anaerobic dimethyl sulfoxide reductase subunit C (anchor subunit)